MGERGEGVVWEDGVYRHGDGELSLGWIVTPRPEVVMESDGPIQGCLTRRCSRECQLRQTQTSGRLLEEWQLAGEDTALGAGWEEAPRLDQGQGLVDVWSHRPAQELVEWSGLRGGAWRSPGVMPILAYPLHLQGPQSGWKTASTRQHTATPSPR